MKIYEIHNGCQICGTGAPRWTWNATGIFGFNACYNCYNNRHKVDELTIVRDLYKQARATHKEGSILYFIEIDRLKRKYVRDIRTKNGVIDTEIMCKFCKQKKSIFEFKFIENKKCCECSDSDEYREELMKKEHVDRTERLITNVSENQCIHALKYRNMAISYENIELIKQLLIAKRIKKIFDFKRGSYESNYTDVYGKQQPDEENNEGRV